MKKHALSEKGLQSMFHKLLRRGLVSEEFLAERTASGVPKKSKGVTADKAQKTLVHAADVLKDIQQNLADAELMRKYKLSPKGLRSMFDKLRRKKLISTTTLSKRKLALLVTASSQGPNLSSSQDASREESE